MGLATLGLAFLAGLLSSLSPCVLPLLPLVLAGAASESRHGPVALALGVALSFVLIGLFVATIGFAIGLDGDVFRFIAAGLMLLIGLALVIPALGYRIAMLAGPLANWADARKGEVAPRGVMGQFVVGLLLGAVWTPCVGPTLGAASVLAAKGESLASVALTMLVFGIGAALPLLIIGLVSRETMLRWRGTLMEGGGALRQGLGMLLIVLGILILSGYDKKLEAWLVELSPAWLTQLTTRF